MKNIVISAIALGLMATSAQAFNASSIQKVEVVSLDVFAEEGEIQPTTPDIHREIDRADGFAQLPATFEGPVLYPWCAMRVVEQGTSHCYRTVWFAPLDDEEIMEEADGFSPLNPAYVQSVVELGQ